MKENIFKSISDIEIIFRIYKKFYKSTIKVKKKPPDKNMAKDLDISPKRYTNGHWVNVTKGSRILGIRDMQIRTTETTTWTHLKYS